MAEKYKPETEEKPAAGDYFERQVLDFIPTGCTLLDCVLGGGWPLGRISNVVGDKAVGKTLLAIEACAYAFPWRRSHFLDSLAAGHWTALWRDDAGELVGYQQQTREMSVHGNFYGVVSPRRFRHAILTRSNGGNWLIDDVRQSALARRARERDLR